MQNFETAFKDFLNQENDFEFEKFINKDSKILKNLTVYPELLPEKEADNKVIKFFNKPNKANVNEFIKQKSKSVWEEEDELCKNFNF